MLHVTCGVCTGDAA